ncbi:MAG: hypothetical protein HFH59_06690 [Lachnospiraceae bacterium]|nr:hypothetical protein [Lachnospiraceae bacterium]
MKIEISGSRCISCGKYTQYYELIKDMAQAIDRGYCGARQCTTRPGNRCKHYQEKSNARVM